MDIITAVIETLKAKDAFKLINKNKNE